MSKYLKPGEITDKRTKLQEVNTNNNNTKKKSFTIEKGGRVPPSTRTKYKFKKV